MKLHNALQKLRTATGTLSLSLYNQNIGVSEISQLMTAIAANTKLTSVKLDLIHNHITSAGAITLAEYIEKSSAKIELDYSGNDVGEKEKILLYNALILNADYKHREKMAQTKPNIVLSVDKFAETHEESLGQDKNQEFENLPEQGESIQTHNTFKSSKCFEVFRENNINLCGDNTDKPIVSIDDQDKFDAGSYLFVESWLIKEPNENLYLNDYYELCLQEFKEKDYVPCNSEEGGYSCWYVTAVVISAFAVVMAVYHHCYGSLPNTQSLLGHTEEGKIDVKIM